MPIHASRLIIHYTCDNIDILDGTLDGKNTFHATQMAAWQRGKTNDASLLEPSIRQALIVPTVLEELHHVSIPPERDKPVFTSPVDEACFSKAEEDNEYARHAKATGLAFFLRSQDLQQ